MNAIFNIIGIPLGYVLWFIYRFVGNYFVSIFLFTLIGARRHLPPVPEVSEEPGGQGQAGAPPGTDSKKVRPG